MGEMADQSIQQIAEQQHHALNMLVSLEEAIKARLPTATEMPLGMDSFPAAAPRLHQQARVLTVQLDELDRQAEDLAKETETVQSGLYAEPLSTVVRVLDAHASALDSIQDQIGDLAQRLRQAESQL